MYTIYWKGVLVGRVTEHTAEMFMVAGHFEPVDLKGEIATYAKYTTTQPRIHTSSNPFGDEIMQPANWSAVAEDGVRRPIWPPAFYLDRQLIKFRWYLEAGSSEESGEGVG
ncbi:MAG: hypothetical protein ACF8R7_15065 [Phycisphaerales bacterium JB039]